MTYLPPRGTRGFELPKPLKSLPDPGNLLFQLGRKIRGLPLIRLTTVGARTGKTRRKVLAWFPDEGRTDAGLLVASNGGSARHPGWAHNLVKNPRQAAIDHRSGPTPIRARLLEGSERRDAWQRVVAVAPLYQGYMTKTDREIPIFHVTSGADAGS